MHVGKKNVKMLNKEMYSYENEIIIIVLSINLLKILKFRNNARENREMDRISSNNRK